PETQNLFYLVSLRLRAARAGVAEISAEGATLVVRFAGAPPPAARRLGPALGVPISVGSNQVRLPRGSGRGWLKTLDQLLELLLPAGPPPALRGSAPGR